MPYNANIPIATDRLKDSQPQLLGNFQAIGAIAGNGNPNSALLSAAAGFNFLYMPVQGAQPNFIATTTNIWTQLNNIVALGNTNQRELFIRTDTANTAANQGIPITSAGRAVKGWTWLPSGILLQWGRTNVLVAGANNNAATGGFAIPFPNACLNVQLTPEGNNLVDQNTAMYVDAVLTVNNFNVWLAMRDSSIGLMRVPLVGYYLAIGW